MHQIYPIPEPGGVPAEILKKRELHGVTDEYVTNIWNFNARTAMMFTRLKLLVNETNLRRGHTFTVQTCC